MTQIIPCLYNNIKAYLAYTNHQNLLFLNTLFLIWFLFYEKIFLLILGRMQYSYFILLLHIIILAYPQLVCLLMVIQALCLIEVF